MKTILTLLLLALSASATAQTVTGMQRNPDGTITTNYSDGRQIITIDRQRPEHPDVAAEREWVAQELAERRAYYASEEYLKERCTAEGNKVFRQSFSYGKYWHYANAPGSMNACAEYRQAKKTRKLKNKKAP